MWEVASVLTTTMYRMQSIPFSHRSWIRSSPLCSKSAIDTGGLLRLGVPLSGYLQLCTVVCHPFTYIFAERRDDATLHAVKGMGYGVTDTASITVLGKDWKFDSISEECTNPQFLHSELHPIYGQNCVQNPCVCFLALEETTGIFRKNSPSK